MFDASSVRIVDRCGRPLAEVEAPAGAIGEKPGAGDGVLAEASAHDVDRLGEPIAPWRVEEGELLRVAQVDGGQADEPNAAPLDPGLRQQGERRRVERLGIAGLPWQGRLAGERLETLVTQLELHGTGGQIVASKAARDRLGQVEPRRLEAG